MTAYVSCAVLTFTTYAFAGTMREQVCEFLCPWPRIQGAMLDPHTLQVTYRKDRGETRGPHKKGATWEGRGDCVDCNQCVVVCPMGIDIRDGAQLACINCGLCADACDVVMAKVGRPLGLIAYDTDANVAARAKGQPPKLRLIRPRTIFYAVLLAAVGTLMLFGFFTRAETAMHVIHDRNPMFVRLHDGSVRNGYVVKIANHTFESRDVRLEISGSPHAALKLASGGDWARSAPVTLAPDQVVTLRVFIRQPAEALAEAEEQPVTFRLAGDQVSESVQSNFATGRGVQR